MQFTDDGVDIPDLLIKALWSDKLLIFVGAGVSAHSSESGHLIHAIPAV